MPQFRYRALDDKGEAVNGTMEETSARRVTRKLQERGFTVNSVEAMYADRGLLRVSKRLKWEELQLLSEQLSAITRGGLPLAPALKALASDLRNPRLKPLLEALHQDLDRGMTLEDAITKQHQYFPPVFAGLVRAGEATGNLAGVLQLLCGYADRMANLKYGLQMVLAYPIMVAMGCVLIVGFLMVMVVPVFAEIFHEFGGELPAPTKLVIAFSDMILHQSATLLISAVVIVAGIFLLRALVFGGETGRARLDALRLNMPFMGYTHYLMSVTRFARTLALLLESRVPVLESLELAGAASGSPALARHVGEAALQVAGGERIADALATTRFFGHNFCWLLAMGEERGEAEVALTSLADATEREVTARDKLFMNMATPVVIVALALVVGFVVVAMYLPIFTLGDAISG